MKARRSVAFIMGIALMAAASAGLTTTAVAVSQTAVTPAATGGGASGTPTCVPDPLLKTDYLAPDGLTTSATAITGYAKISQYQAPDGSVVSDIHPPEGFDPTNASDATLAAFGIQPRPADTTGKAHWLSTVASVHKWAAPTVPCSSPAYATSWNAWGGGVDVGNSDYRKADMSFVIPTFTASCPSASDAVVWAGVGGNGRPTLLQAGVTTNQGSLNGVTRFYEWLKLNGGVSEQLDGSTLPAGENIGTSTYYNISLNNAYFYWVDLDNGTAYDTIQLSNAGQFYDGYSAEFIHEKPKSGQNYLRNWGSDYVSGAYATRAGLSSQPFGNYPRSFLKMYNPNGDLMAQVGSGGFGSSSWYYNWVACS